MPSPQTPVAHPPIRVQVGNLTQVVAQIATTFSLGRLRRDDVGERTNVSNRSICVRIF